MRLETDHLDFIGVNEFNKAITMSKSLVKKYNGSIYFYGNGFNIKNLPEDAPKFYYKSADSYYNDYMIIGLHLFKKDLCVIICQVIDGEISYESAYPELYARDITDKKQFLSLFKHFFKVNKL